MFKKKKDNLPARVADENPIIDDDEEEIQPDERYINISKKIRTLKYFVLMLLIIFLLFTVTMFSDKITTDGFRYIIKDINIDFSSEDTVYNDIVYSSEGKMNFDIFRNDIAVSTKSGVQIFNSEGSNIMNSTYKYSNPTLLVGNKYLLVYDLGYYDVSLFNSFSLVYSVRFEHPVSGAYINDNGMFAIVTKTDLYKSAVYIYNASFERVYEWYSNDKLVMNVVLSLDGENLMILASYADGGVFKSEVLFANRRSENINSVYSVADTFAIDAYNCGEGYGFVFDNQIVFIDKDGKITNQYEFQFSNILKCENSDGKTVICTKKSVVGENKEITVFDEKGNEIYKTEFEVEIEDIEVAGKYIYLVLNTKICRIDIEKNEFTYYNADDSVMKIIIINEKNIMLMTHSKGIVISAENKFIKQ